MVAGTPVPLLRDAGRSELHHAERHVRSHEHMSVSTRSDLRVYEVGVTFRSGASCQEQCRKHEFYLAHKSLCFSVLLKPRAAKGEHAVCVSY